MDTDERLKPTERDVREEVVSKIEEIEKVQNGKIKCVIGKEVDNNLGKVKEPLDNVNMRSEELIKPFNFYFIYT